MSLGQSFQNIDINFLICKMGIVSINEIMYIMETFLFVPFATCPWPCICHRQSTSHVVHPGCNTSHIHCSSGTVAQIPAKSSPGMHSCPWTNPLISGARELVVKDQALVLHLEVHSTARKETEAHSGMSPSYFQWDLVTICSQWE